MAITKTVNVETTNARASTTLTDTTPTVPLPDTPQGLMVIGPQVTLHFVEGEWNQANSYDYYDVVQVDGNSYIAVQDVPANTEITNTTYWAKWNDPNAQVKQMQDTIATYNGRINNVEIGLAKLERGIKRLNVIDYGADPTGESDSYPAFASAVSHAITAISDIVMFEPSGRSAQVEIYIPQGVYTLSSAITISGKNKVASSSDTLIAGISFLGDGCESSILSFNGTNGITSNSGLVTIKNLQIYNAETAINFTAMAPYVIIDNVHFCKCSTAVHFNGTYSTSIENCVVIEPEIYGFYIGGTGTSVRLAHNYVAATNKGTGYYIESYIYTVLDNNYCDGCNIAYDFNLNGANITLNCCGCEYCNKAMHVNSASSYIYNLCFTPIGFTTCVSIDTFSNSNIKMVSPFFPKTWEGPLFVSSTNMPLSSSITIEDCGPNGRRTEVHSFNDGNCNLNMKNCVTRYIQSLTDQKQVVCKFKAISDAFIKLNINAGNFKIVGFYYISGAEITKVYQSESSNIGAINITYDGSNIYIARTQNTPINDVNVSVRVYNAKYSD